MPIVCQAKYSFSYMRYIFFVALFITLSSLVTATDYYVSSSGNDANNGLSESTPWKTISKVNSSFSAFQPGDRILFKRGDTFYGTLVIKKSGLVGTPITIGAYGTGAQPVITGFTTLSSWLYEGNGIYSTQVTSSGQTNMVTVNGIQAGMGRFPDSGTNLTYTTATATSIVDPDLSDATDWSGAELVINKNDWTLDRCRITDQSGDAFTFVNLGSANIPYSNRYYFIQNDLRCVTATNEWYHNTSTGKLYIYGAPSSKTVKMATLNYLIDNASYDNIIVDGINFQGSISHAVYCAYGSDNWTIRNCTIGFAGHSGIYFVGGNNAFIDNNEISWCNTSGIYTVVSNSSITNNSVLQTGMIPGQSLLYHPIGIFISGLNFLLQYNDIQYSGWSGIVPATGTTFTIKNNFMNYSCQFLDDGGGIYITGTAGSLRTIEGNIVLNSGIGGSDNERTRGIYLDGAASNVMVKDNTAANCFVDGIANHGGINNTYVGNTSYNNPVAMLFQQYTPTDKITGTALRNNIFFAREDDHYAMRFMAPSDNILNFGSADYNYYARPIKDDDVIITYDESTGSKKRTLEEWQYFTSQDANSGKSPITITDIKNIRFEYNASKTNKIVTLDRPVIDVKGTKYEGSVTLLPYTSAILMYIPDPSHPEVPVYVGSVIEQISPARIEMTYNMILAEVIPPASAFRVMVNSVARTVTSINISGTKVELTLSSPVKEGDIVTVAYTKPASNPLQSASTGLAESFTAKTVTNKADSRRPSLSSLSVESNTPNIIKMTFNQNLATIVPPASAFTVRVNSMPGAVGSVRISGTDVILTLSSPVVSGDVITVAYTVPSTNALRSALNWYVLSFSPQAVTNKIVASSPVLISAYVENTSPNTLEMTYSTDLASIVPPASAFSVKVNSIARTVNKVSVSGPEVSLTLASPVAAGDVITVAYTIPSTDALRSVSGYNVLSFSAKPVTNNVNELRPVLVSSSVESAAPNILEMTFSLELSGTYIPPTTAFTVMINSIPRSVNTVAVSGTDVTLSLGSSVVSGDVITVAYTSPASNALRSVTGWYVLSFSAKPVTNNVSGLRPVLVSSSVENAATNILKMIFNLALSGSYVPAAAAFTVMVNSVPLTVNSVSLSGSEVFLTLGRSVVSGDVITVAYTVPSTNALRSVPGWYVLSFSAKPVTNNVAKPATNNVNDLRPVLVSASVEVTTPSILDMVFSLTLSGSYVPPATAFSVMVNSVRRTVNTVLISGTSVKLTLSSSIVYGDVITVAYTIPSTNALRSVPGWYVLSFSAQTVINNMVGSKSRIAETSSPSDGNISIYPNPASDFINVCISEPSSKPQIIRIFDSLGRLCQETRLDPDIDYLNIPIDLNPGLYILRIVEGSATKITHKLIVL